MVPSRVRLPSIPARISRGPAWAREPSGSDIARFRSDPESPCHGTPSPPAAAVTGSVLSFVSRACNQRCPGQCWEQLLGVPGPAVRLASRPEAEVTENHSQAFSAGPIHPVLAAGILSWESALLATIIREAPSSERLPVCPWRELFCCVDLLVVCACQLAGSSARLSREESLGLRAYAQRSPTGADPLCSVASVPASGLGMVRFWMQSLFSGFLMGSRDLPGA